MEGSDGIGGPSQVAKFVRRVRDDPAPVCIKSPSQPLQRSYDLSGYRLTLRGSDPDFNFQRSYRNLDNPLEGWNVKFISSERFEAAWVRSTGAGGAMRQVGYVTGTYRWVPDRHTRWGSLTMTVTDLQDESASDFGAVLSMTINGDDPLATSSWGPLYASFEPSAFPSPGARAEHAQLTQTFLPVENQQRLLYRQTAATTPAPSLWSVGADLATVRFVQSL